MHYMLQDQITSNTVDLRELSFICVGNLSKIIKFLVRILILWEIRTHCPVSRSTNSLWCVSQSIIYCVHRRSSSFSHWQRHLPTQDCFSCGQQDGVLPVTPSATSRFQPLEPPSAAPQLLYQHQQHCRTPCDSAPTSHHNSSQHRVCQEHAQ